MKYIQLGKICEFIMGQAPPGDFCNFDSNGMPFVKAGEFSSLYPEIKEWTTQPLKIGQGGDVFICVVGATSGKLNLGIDCAIGRSVAAIRPRKNILDQIYLYNFLKTWTDKLRSRSQGSAQGVITKPMLSELEIPLPPLDEQRRIAAILDNADAIRRKRQESIRLTEEFLRSTFLEMFGDPVTNPKGWRVCKINEICSEIVDCVNSA